jgi:enoyl-CoA hydratase
VTGPGGTGPDGTGLVLRQFDHFEIRRHGPVAVAHINRPAKLNTMTTQFWPQLRGLLGELARDSVTRVVVITGKGDRAFSAGGDIVSFARLGTPAARREFMTECLAAFAAVEECPLPVIAAVNGYALGGGCELAFACDIVLAAESAVFGLPEASVGLVPGFGVLRGPSVVGRQWAKLMVLAGERLGAGQARELGIVQKVVPDGELLPAAMELAGRIAAQAPLAVAVGKRIINRGVDRGEASYSVEALSLLYSTQDAAEGIAAFIQRREPRFEGS